MHRSLTLPSAIRSGLLSIGVVALVTVGWLSPAPFLARMEMVKSLSSSSPVRVKALADPATNSMTFIPPTPGQPRTEKLYVMRKESTTSPGGWDQVRAMEVLSGVETVSTVGEEGRMAVGGANMS